MFINKKTINNNDVYIEGAEFASLPMRCFWNFFPPQSSLQFIGSFEYLRWRMLCDSMVGFATIKLHFCVIETVQRHPKMQRSNSSRKQAASSDDTEGGDATSEDRVDLPIQGSRKRCRPDGGRTIGERETSTKPSDQSLESKWSEGPTSHLSFGETKRSDVEPQKLSKMSHLGPMSSSSRSSNLPNVSSNTNNRSQKGRPKKETISSSREMPDDSSRISREGELHDLPQDIDVGQQDDAENSSSEPQDKASLLYTDNIMAAAAATNEMASAGSNFSSQGDRSAIGLQQRTSMGQDDLSSVSAAGLLDVATSQVLINQLILQNAELRHRNMLLHQELEKVKQQVASVLTQLTMAQQQPNLLVPPSPTSGTEIDFLRRIYPGLVGVGGNRNINPGAVLSPSHAGQRVQGAPHRADAAAASVLTQFQQQPVMETTATSFLNQFLNEGTSHHHEEQHQLHHHQRNRPLCHQLCFNE